MKIFSQTMPSTWAALVVATAALGSFDVAAQNVAESAQPATEIDADYFYGQFERANNYLALGERQLREGDYNAAIRAFESSLRVAENVHDVHPGHLDVRRLIAGSLNKLGDGLMYAENYSAAMDNFQRALTLSKESVEADPIATDLKQDVLDSHVRIARAFERMGDWARSLAHTEQALRAAEALAEAEPDNQNHISQVALTNQMLGTLSLQAGQPDEALAYIEEALRHLKALAFRDTAAHWEHFNVATTLALKGDALRHLNRPDEARESYKASIDGLETLVEDHPANFMYAKNLSRILRICAHLLERQADWITALQLAEQAHAINLRLRASRPQNDTFKANLGQSFNSLGIVQFYMNLHEEAEASFVQSLAISQKLVEEMPSDMSRQRVLLASLGGYSNLLLHQKRLDELREVANNMLRLCGTLAADFPDSTAVRELPSCRIATAELRVAEDDIEGAIASYREALSVGTGPSAASDIYVRSARAILQGRLADLLITTDKPGQARALIEEAVPVMAALANESPDNAYFQERLAMLHAVLEELDKKGESTLQ